MHATAVIIGAGQAGLAMSRRLSDAGVDHVVFERGAIANAWQTERWDSLCLLTPNWMTRLPGSTSPSQHPDGYESARQVAQRLIDYATSFDAPVHTGVEVTHLTRDAQGYVVSTNCGTWSCSTVVIASGACSTPYVPQLAASLPEHIEQITPIHYRNPAMLPDGDVLVVGASASGLQLADEITRSGRTVTVAVGAHTRIPRTHRGRDILWWGETIGWLDETVAEMGTDVDLDALRRRPSMQLVGSADRRNLDLNTLGEHGANIVGRFVEVRDGLACFDDSLAATTAAADHAMFDLLTDIEKFIAHSGLGAELAEPQLPARTCVGPGIEPLDLDRLGSVIWATGFRPHLPWVDGRWLNERGAIVHDGGVVDDGLYVLGLPFLRRRKSSFIDGVGPDSADIANSLLAHLESA
ncbi:MAG: NAD(P)-binding domain-containing protein [Ilumatobacter sp.]